MPTHNTATSYGSVARLFHWATAVLILSAMGLALGAEFVSRETEAGRAALMAIFSAHKTIGVLAFFVALGRVIWAVMQPHPVSLHPERKLESFAASAVHWALYGAMILMPLSGWVGHAARQGFAPIRWPFGQGLPFVPLSEAVARAAEHLHEAMAVLLYLAIAAHVAGALKHALLDRDATLARMARGVSAGVAGLREGALVRRGAPIAAGLALAVVLGFGLMSGETFGEETVAVESAATPLAGTDPRPAGTETRPAGRAQSAQSATSQGNWQMVSGSLGIEITQMGSKVAGNFARFTPEISYDPATRTGSVSVAIELGSLSLGSVTDQALGADFFAASQFPQAVFVAEIEPAATPTGHIARGTLTLKGVAVPVEMPFELTIADGLARMQGGLTVQRLAFGIGTSYADEATIAHDVAVKVALEAVAR